MQNIWEVLGRTCHVWVTKHLILQHYNKCQCPARMPKAPSWLQMFSLSTRHEHSLSLHFPTSLVLLFLKRRKEKVLEAKLKHFFYHSWHNMSIPTLRNKEIIHWTLLVNLLRIISLSKDHLLQQKANWAKLSHSFPWTQKLLYWLIHFTA